MSGTDTKILTVFGNHGKLTVDAATGLVLAYPPTDRKCHCHEEGCERYRFIQRVDVETLCRERGPLGRVDILMVGYWCNDGYFEEPIPDEDWIEKEGRGVWFA